MWLPQEMTEIELVIPEHFGSRVTALLANEGVFHQDDVSYLSVETNLAGDLDWRSKATEYANMERRLISTMKSLGVPEETVSDADLPTVVDPELIRTSAEHLEHEVQSILDQMANTSKQIEKLQNYMDQLSPFIDLDIQFDKIRNRHYLYSVLGSIPEENIARLKTSLTRIPFALLELKRDLPQKQAVVLLLGLRQNKDNLKRAARSAYLNAIDLPDEFQGTPAEIIKQLKAKIEVLRVEFAAENEMIGELRMTLAHQFQFLLGRVRISRLLAEAMTRYGKLRYTYLIVGWVPTARLELLAEMLRAISGEIAMETKAVNRTKDAREAPVLLYNPGLAGVFQGLVTTYGLPGYRELDPTVLMAITFPLLFGAMFGDVGHGLILAMLGGLLLSKKIMKLAGMASMGGIILACGLAAIVFGFLYGSFFGIEELLPALWLRPMENIMTVILITIAFGVGILTMAYVLSLINSIRKRQWAHVFLGGSGLSGLVLYWSLLGLVVSMLVANFPIPMFFLITLAGISALIVFFSELIDRALNRKKPLIEDGIATFFIESFFELFEILIGFLSNTLSYARVGAFAVAHAGLSTAVFILADMAGGAGSIGYWLVVMAGSLFIVGFEGMIVGIQTLRLEYYEFFSKFFTGGGKEYLPLHLQQTKKQGVK